jgi:LysM repeat protein
VAPRRLPSETETPPDGRATQSQEAPPNRDTIAASLSLREEFRVYLVQQGDSLWKIARRFDMNHRALATINGIAITASLQVGRPLKVKAATSRELRLDLTSGPLARHPSLLEHIRMIDGRPVPRWLVTDYVADILDKRPPGSPETPQGAPMRDLTIVIQFQLVRNLLEGRARQYHPIVRAHAQKFNLDPALIMAMIHTESAFNPKARSHASAYGLMQLVPHTAGREAYQRVYGQRRELTPQYLFDPHNNIELGTAYLHILKNSYLGSITDPLSRTYCAVAAYHAGPSNVWKAFIAEPLIKEAIPAINRLTPADVYQRLVEALPSTESRNYLRDVIKRVSLYGDAFGKNSGTMI